MGERPLTVLTHRVFPETLAMLADWTDLVTNDSDGTLPPDELLRRCRSADAMMAFMPDCVDAAFLSACPKLKVIACALKGYDNFDVEACSRQGVWVTIVDDLLTVPTAELAIGLLIGVARHVMTGDREIRGGSFTGWRPTLYGMGLAGRTVGIVGMGKVGQAIAQRLKGFDAELIYADARPLDPVTQAVLDLTRTGFEELICRADFIIMATPLTEGTLHLIDASALRMMKPGAILVNPGRGSVVDEEAVAGALSDGQLAAYAADVFEFEDWARSDRPRAIPESLLALTEKTLFTPHIGSAVVDARKAIEAEAATSILEALRGDRPTGAVNDVAS